MKKLLEKAEKDDQSCIFEIKGCTIIDSKNYNKDANVDDGSCIINKYGCMDKTAGNYDRNANTDDNSCVPKKEGCTNKNALNYDKYATHDNKSCTFKNFNYKYQEKNKKISNIIFYQIIIISIIIYIYLKIIKTLIK